MPPTKKTKVPFYTSGGIVYVDDGNGNGNGDSESDEDVEESDDEPDRIPADVEARLKYIQSLVGSLSKRFLEDIMKQVSYYGPQGTNREMANCIVVHLRGMAAQGDNLKMEEKLVRRVYGQCWGPDEESNSESEEDEGEDEDEDEDDVGTNYISDEIQNRLDRLKFLIKGLTEYP
ncbi:hypothetical protein M422DRAFT_785067, partial [Sphaerobolus stellatus SS14]